MRISIVQCYTEPGASYNFRNTDWIAKQLDRRLRPSKSFLQNYSKAYRVTLWLNAKSKLAKPILSGSIHRRRSKEIEFFIHIPHNGRKAKWPADYVQALKHFLTGTIMVFEKLGIDASQVLTDSPALIKQFSAMPESEMVFKDWDDDSRDNIASSDPVENLRTKSKATVPSRRKNRKKPLPEWKVPKGIERIIEEEGEWETERFAPLRLLVMPGTGQKAPLDWQIELDIDLKDKQYANALAKIKTMGNDPDGDGWTELIEQEFTKRYPKLARELDSDSEMATCVVLVKSEEACKKLLELVWSLIYSK